jgi:hypothetical protein
MGGGEWRIVEKTRIDDGRVRVRMERGDPDQSPDVLMLTIDPCSADELYEGELFEVKISKASLKVLT